jgi:hypothetical protein
MMRAGAPGMQVRSRRTQLEQQLGSSCAVQPAKDLRSTPGTCLATLATAAAWDTPTQHAGALQLAVVRSSHWTNPSKSCAPAFLPYQPYPMYNMTLHTSFA